MYVHGSQPSPEAASEATAQPGREDGGTAVSPQLVAKLKGDQQGGQLQRRIFGVSAMLVGVGAFAAGRMGTAGPLEGLKAVAMPLDDALGNGRPTLIEFYADWCKTCRHMVRPTLEVTRTYARDVNFVMLNIDNPKWQNEARAYQVRSIPEYVFLDAANEPQAVLVGDVPMRILEGNTQALATGKEVPFANFKSMVVTPVEERDVLTGGPTQAGPLDHGAR